MATENYSIARKAIEQMERHKIAPTAENYRLWYAVAEGGNATLAQEIKQLGTQKVAITAEVSDYLCNKYFPAPENAGAAGAEEAREVLATVMKMVAQFSGDTAAYNAKIDQHTVNLVKKADGKEGVGGILQEVITQLKDIKSTGSNFSQKLDSSQQEIEALRKNLEKATAESRRDFLTGLHNRRAFDELISEHIEIAESQFKELCLLMVDIDHFKKFNDKWGHQTGDEVIKLVGKALTGNIRGSDVVARFGGEEFVVMLPGTPPNGALIVAENIRKTIAGSKLKRKDSQEDLGQITVSVGVARYRIGEEDTVPFIIKRADEALYSAKHHGRNKVVAEF
jgi:diguanylate cyclase